jgi:ribonucleoside-diphosphate reductase beta chain
MSDFKQIKQFKAVNWDQVNDAIDKATWEKLTEQFWLDTRIPVSNDMDDWRTLDEDHQWLVGHVFGGLTLLDTVQSEQGMASLRQTVRTQHETAVLNNIQFMESVHAKSYSTIFSTLNTPDQISEIFEWTDTEEFLQNKAVRITNM